MTRDDTQWRLSKNTVPYFLLSRLMVTVILQRWGLPTPSDNLMLSLGDRRCYTKHPTLIVASVATRHPRPPNPPIPSAISQASNH